MELGDIDLVVNEVPVTIVGHVVDTYDTTRGRILEGGRRNGSDAEVDSLVKAHIVAVVGVENTIGEGATRADSEEAAAQSRGIVVNVIEGSASLVRASEHGAHGQAVALVLAHDRAEHHRGHGHRGRLAVSQLVDAAEHSDVALPELTVGSTASHRAEQEVIDLDNLAHLVGRDEGALGGSGIDGDEDTLLELEGERGRTLGEIGHFGGHLLQVALEMHLVVDGGELEAEAVGADLVGEGLLGLTLVFHRREDLLSGDLRRNCVNRRSREA
mmetsp:Transcript_32433/g.40178  ORF Transcript_32433/g.40178 Transcript_32433/m.40178 type:complete len:271 (-) Transcript_32433:91-903(-)